MPLIDNVFTEELSLPATDGAVASINPQRVSALAGSQYEYLPWDARIEIGALMTRNNAGADTVHNLSLIHISEPTRPY